MVMTLIPTMMTKDQRLLWMNLVKVRTLRTDYYGLVGSEKSWQHVVRVAAAVAVAATTAAVTVAAVH